MPKNQIRSMNKMFLASVSLLVVLILIIFYSTGFYITGFGIGRAADVNVNESFEGEITAFVYSPALNLTETQNITVEFTNTGTTPYNTTIYISVYIYENEKLNLSAQYYDYTVPLFPGMKKFFKAYYMPPRVGTYYIKVLVHYGSRRMETWGAFSVSVFEVPENVTEVPIPPGPPAGGGVVPTIYFAGRPILNLDLQYPEIVDMYRGQTVMIGVRAKNTGNSTLRNLKMYISTPYTIDISVNPKEVYLDPNETSVFLLSIYVKPGAEVGIHLINFDFVSQRLKKSGIIQINVTAFEIPREEEIQNRILNNKYLIMELEGQFLAALKKGINTTLAERSLNRAKAYLDSAEDYFNLANLEKAMEELDKKDENLKDAVFQLAHEAFKVYFPPAFSPLWILLIAILMGLIFLIISKKRKKKKKPRLLRGGEEESEI